MSNVHRRIGDAAILIDISLSVATGETLHIVGPSGSGKSSLLRLLNRLDEVSRPASGDGPASGDTSGDTSGGGGITILDRLIADWPIRELRRSVSMVLQEPSLLGLTVRENLMLPFTLVNEKPADIDPRVTRALQRVGLDPAMADRVADQLSVGQKQRVTLARALMVEPRILLLDEPTASVDVRTAGQLLQQIQRLAAESHLTVVMVTHRLEEARKMGGRLAVLIAGRLEAIGPVEQVFADPPNETVRAFLHGEHHAR
ncbi:MAG: ATP-binding cassette domain-containing protein [Phycisphaeraceae bacterium]